MKEATLRDLIARIGDEAGASAVAVAVRDFERRSAWYMNRDDWFHAASTIKVPVLLGVFDAIEQGRLGAGSRVHIRNRFLSIVDDAPFRVEASRDANTAVHAALGKTMSIGELAEHMIVTSSNLATNLLIDVVGLDHIRATIDRLDISGIDVRRGVEDEAAWEAGINNRITAAGLAAALELIEERRAISEAASDAMLEILHKQRFRSGIPAGLPEDARVANKTGEMSTVAHDGGIVYIEGRKPYVVVILTEWARGGERRQATIARISRAVYHKVRATR